MPEKKRRGFAAMDPAKQKSLASAGGKSVPAGKRSFATNKDLAKSAGTKGGQVSGNKNKKK